MFFPIRIQRDGAGAGPHQAARRPQGRQSGGGRRAQQRGREKDVGGPGRCCHHPGHQERPE